MKIIWILLTFVGLCLAKIDSRQKSVLQNTVKALLDFKNLPRPAEVIRPVSKTANVASQYMRNLYKEYQHKNSRASPQGNIVRSINPSLGTIDGQELLLFNLKTIKPQENIIRAEVHFNLRAKHHAKKRAKRVVRCVAVTPRGARINMYPMNTEASWLGWDARYMVVSTLQNSSLPPQFGLEFSRLVRKTKTIKTIDPLKVLKRHSPFMLIYSDTPTLMDKEQVMSALLEDQKNDVTLESNRVKRSVDQYYGYQSHVTETPPTPTDNHAHIRAYLSNGPDLLLSRKELRQRRRKGRNRNRKDELPYPEGHARFGVEPKSIKELNNTYYTNDINEHSTIDQPTVVLLGNDKWKEEDYCAKQELFVDFNEIGWKHWIIAPSSFGAHYCSGSCKFPLGPAVNPSNHAIIQSIIHTIGLNPHVPAVSCAPVKMDSLTLLYFDEDDNVVLKNFPKMTVSSCGCL